jgi:hypothetical protein
MHSNNRIGSRAARARGVMALFAIVLAMGLALAACPAEAAPFAYVVGVAYNSTATAVYVIDTATHPASLVATIPVGNFPHAGWDTRLCREPKLQQCFGDRDDQ